MNIERLKLSLQMSLGMALFGSATPVSKIIADSFPTFVASSLRVSIAAIILLPFLAYLFPVLKRLNRFDWLKLCLIALFGMFGFTVLLLFGMRLVPGVVGSIVMSTTPAITAVASVVFFNESLTRIRILAVILAIGGVLIIQIGGQGLIVSSASALLIGSLLVLLAVCCEVAYSLLGKAVSGELKPLSVVFLAAVLSIPLFAPFATYELYTGPFPEIPIQDWLWMMWWAGGTLALGSLLWYDGLSKVEGSYAAGFMSVMPVSALILSYVILEEPFYWIHLVGFFLVFVGVLLLITEK